MECILGQVIDGIGWEKKSTRTINVLLQNDRKRAKQRLFERRQCCWGTVYDEPVHVSVLSSVRRFRTHRINAEMLSKMY